MESEGRSTRFVPGVSNMGPPAALAGLREAQGCLGLTTLNPVHFFVPFDFSWA